MSEMIRIGSFQGPIADNDFDRNLGKVKAVLSQELQCGVIGIRARPGHSKSGSHCRGIRSILRLAADRENQPEIDCQSCETK